MMEVSRASAALLHGQTSMLAFLAPSFTRPCTTRLASPIIRSVHEHSLFRPTRSFSTTPSRREEGSPPKPNASALDNIFTDTLNRTLDGTKGVPTTSTQRTTRFASPAAQQANRKVASSLDDLFGALSTPSQGSRVGRFTDPQGNLQRPRNPLKLPEPPFKLGPSVGRTVDVDPNRGMDVGRAFKSLEQNCGRNKVRVDFTSQLFHERPGLKRKRLKTQRWRRRFKEGFRGMVKMVSQMRKQGW